MPLPAPLVAPETLLSPALLARLRQLASRILRRSERGESRGGGGGATPEFDGYRAYTPGDDPRFLDWSVYARLERLLVKVYAPESRGSVGVLLDTSASMRIGRGEKALCAARCAAAFAYLGLCTRRPVVLGVFADGLLGVGGPYRNLEGFADCLRFAAAAPTGAGTRLGAAATDFFSRARDRGSLFVVSDFFQEESLPQELAAISERVGSLHLVQVLALRDCEPRLSGTCLVEDPESERRLRLVAGRELQAQLRALVAGHLDAFARLCRGLGVVHGVIRAEERFDEAFLRHLLEQSG